MSKMVCDICGTTYDDASGACPVCGWKPGTTLDTSADMDDVLGDDFSIEDLDAELSDTPPQKNKAVFDFDAVNPRRQASPAPTAAAKPAKPAQPARPARPARPAPAPAPVEEEEEEEPGSNKFLVIILVVLILALLAVSGYIAYTKLWKPNQKGSDTNKPQETISAQPLETTEEGTTEATTETTTEATEPTIPCTGLSLVASMDTLTYAGQNWRLMAKYAPDDTTDKVTYTSGDESVVTVDEYGRVTAVGEGETVIVIACGDKRFETPAVVNFGTAATETTAAPVEGTSGTGASGSNVATPSSGVLKLKKTDVTISRRGVYITLELENGISAESVKWTTSDSGIATVYNGNVTAIGRGTCVIFAEYEGQVAECVVRCKF